MTLGFVFALSACTNQPKAPLFSASGFIADDGVVRLWRLNDQNNKPLVLMSVYSPYRNENTIVTFYEYKQGYLRQIRREILNDENPLAEQLRLDKSGDVIFMQKQLKTRRERLSNDDIVRMRFDAKRALELSDALIVGNVRLMQGHWNNGKVTTCTGETISVEFEPYAKSWLEQREKNSYGQLTIAWLEASAGRELLLVANDDFCRWEPTKDSL
ncbi:hypothetical protein Ppb6_03438 [Photorhabdus australis subsp. thailandensis]|uniref:DUF1481 domain-containing protein n=1 Tax=Photorhabdus australis subsp. thailandensis TaxID=2805096 RepID=A0A1C0U0I4_9GAMM|nr:DUF1481 domain-containing protein [Photorhabdus australis]OCQ51366.1 hypothetical protein Ppb6_03438 [Photorhabdus australis subsp. thailandensis]